MCMWHEGVGGRGANEIVSCLFKVLLSGVIVKNRLVIWADNCAAQNKNRMMIMALIYLVSKRYCDCIELKFLVSGHSFMDCDRDFGVIEKRRKVSKAMIPEELQDVVKSARVNNPFKVVPILKEDFKDFG